LILKSRPGSDLYDVVFHGPLLPTEHIDPAEYPPGKTRENENRRPSTVNDICDFIVEYVNSDVLVRFSVIPHFPLMTRYLQGLLSDRHLIIAGKITAIYAMFA
jgi:RNA-dependent RNA polymerase